tara:strand:- start:483 stop:1172 length:690 start_codon:yes stop_codon:yes gene_type:complete
MKKYFILILIVFLFIFTFNFASGHVNHYKKVKFLKYGVFLNNELIGTHIFNFKKEGDFFYVNTKGDFKVKKLGVVLMNYKTKSEEIYKNGQLVKFNSKTNQNEKEKFAQVILNEKNKLYINGSSHKGETESSSLVGSWWNHEIVKNSKQISPISGRIINQKVRFLGKKNILINGKEYNALHFHFLSDDNNSAEKKKLNIHVWYDSETLLWVKARYDKLGKWEYRLVEIK